MTFKPFLKFIFKICSIMQPFLNSTGFSIFEVIARLFCLIVVFWNKKDLHLDLDFCFYSNFSVLFWPSVLAFL